MNGAAEAYKNTVMLPEEFSICSSALTTLVTGKLPADFNSTKDREYVETALSILADSTSAGPDPREIKHLGWSYSDGPGAGSEGNWDSCQSLRDGKPIGKALYQMQEVLLKSSNPTSQHNFESSHFCTIGALPPWDVISHDSIQTWNSPFAGVCVPGICTARALYYLFDATNGYGDTILNLALENKITSLENMNRLRYISSLTKSLQTAKTFQAGILCQDQTGSAIIDKGYRDFGYYATISLTLLLMTCVLIGTIASSYIRSKKRKISQISFKRCICQEEPKPFIPSKQANNSILQSLSHKINYGSNNVTFINIGDDKTSPTSDLSPSTQDSKVSAYRIEAFENNEQSPNENDETEFFFNLMACLHSTLGIYFDASQNFYEIARLKSSTNWSGPMYDKCHQMKGIDTHNYSAFSLTNENGLTHQQHENDHNKDRIEFTSSSQITQTISSSKCLNGLRSISMLWIILGHTLSTQSSVGYTNPSKFFPPDGMISNYFGSFIMSASYAVDTFLFISGYLGMSSLLKRLDPELRKMHHTNGEIQQVAISSLAFWRRYLSQIGVLNPFHEDIGDYGQKRLLMNQKSHLNGKGIKWVFPFLLHRILRILPTYALVLLLWWKVTITLGDGPFWPHWATFTQRCDKYAWTNMLFVNNLIPWDQPSGEMSECMFHTWYLGVDFQLYAILTPICIALYLHVNRKITILLELLLVIVIIALSFFGTFYFNWSAYTIDGIQSVSYDRGFYINPIFRATPFIIGFISAQLWHEKSRVWPNFGFTNNVSFFLSISSVILMAYLPFWSVGAYNNRPCLPYEDPSQIADCGTGLSQYHKAIFNSLMRPLWSMGLAVISMLSFNGQLNFLGANYVLTWSGWDPIGKLSFSMYLLHPLVGNYILLGRTSKLRYTPAGFITMYAGISVLTFLLSLCIGLLVEWPLSKITRDFEKKMYFGKEKSSRTELRPTA